jgi:hypothetical protein
MWKVAHRCAWCLLSAITLASCGMIIFGVVSYVRPFACGLHSAEVVGSEFRKTGVSIYATYGEIECVWSHLHYDSVHLIYTKDSAFSPHIWISDQGDDKPVLTFLRSRGYFGHDLLEDVGFFVHVFPEEVAAKRSGTTIVIASPWWFYVVPLLGGVVVLCRKGRACLLRRRWKKSGCCLKCGYPLLPTGAVSRCPECGTPVNPATKELPRAP